VLKVVQEDQGQQRGREVDRLPTPTEHPCAPTPRLERQLGFEGFEIIGGKRDSRTVVPVLPKFDQAALLVPCPTLQPAPGMAAWHAVG
jgi:hypothetical protein